MRRRAAIFGCAVMLGAGLPLPALARQGPGVEASIVSDYRERGLSWSGGRAVAQLYLDAPLGSGIGASVRATTARGAARHGAADGAFALRLDYRGDAGLVYWRGGVTGHLFAGAAGRQDYVAGDLAAGVMFGLLDISVKASYAPSQGAIGGSNLYLRSGASFGLPGTPVMLSGHIGRSSGHVDDPLRAARLRPGGAYRDWGVGLDYNKGRLRLSLDYTDTDIAHDRIAFPKISAHHGTALVAGAHVSF